MADNAIGYVTQDGRVFCNACAPAVRDALLPRSVRQLREWPGRVDCTKCRAPLDREAPCPAS